MEDRGSRDYAIFDPRSSIFDPRSSILDRMRLSYFTTLPPSKSGIADYNSELLPYLAKGAEISVFVADEAESHLLPLVRLPNSWLHLFLKDHKSVPLLLRSFHVAMSDAPKL